MISWPSEPSGPSPAAAWFRAILRAARACQILPGRGYKLKQGANGITLEIEPAAPRIAGTTSNPVVLQVYSYTRAWSAGDRVIVPQASTVVIGSITYLILAGIYECVQDVPGSPTAYNQLPIYPEPAVDILIYWYLVSLRPQLTVGCGQSPAYVCASGPLLMT